MINYWAIILLLAASQGMLLGSVLIFPGRKRDHSNPFLGLMILIISLELLNAWGIQVKYHQSTNVFPFWLLESYLILPASLWLFTKAAIEPAFRFRTKYLLLYIPAFIEIAVESAAYIRYRITGEPSNLLGIKAWFVFTEVMPVLWMLAALFFYGRSLHQFYRDQPVTKGPERIHKIRNYGILFIFSLLTACWIGEAFLYLPIFTFVAVLLMSILFTAAYLGYARPAFFERAKSNVKKTKSKFFTNYDDKKESERLVLLLEQTGMHTRPGLTLEELAHELGLPVRYVSYLLNSYFSTSFHHFINAYRVKEVIRKINDPSQKHKTLLALAFESGFNSKSSFNKVFKDHTGHSPSQYLAK